MAYLEFLLWVYFIFYPLYIYLTHEKEKYDVVNQHISKISVYVKTMLYLWLPCLILALIVTTERLSLKQLGLTLNFNAANVIGMSILILLVIYLLFSLKRLKQDQAQQNELKAHYDFMHWFLPTTVKESRYFIFGLSITAGVCEEVLFRGYLMHLFNPIMPTYLAVGLSSLLFGFCHIYQGWTYVLRTAIIGVVFCVIFLLTDSLIIPILLHIVFDMYSGITAYILYSKPQKLEFTKLKTE